MGCGKACFGRRGRKPPKIENFGLKVCPSGTSRGAAPLTLRGGAILRRYLKIHVGKTHNKVDSDLATPEVARNQLRSSVSLSKSPLLNTLRRTPLSTMKVWLGIRFAPNLCQSTPAPLACAVSFERPKNRRGIGQR